MERHGNEADSGRVAISIVPEGGIFFKPQDRAGTMGRRLRMMPRADFLRDRGYTETPGEYRPGFQ